MRIEMPQYVGEYLGVRLASLPAGPKASLAASERYAGVYAALNAGDGSVPEDLFPAKTRYGELLRGMYLDPWRASHGRPPRILSVGAGLAMIERAWLRDGYDVTLQELRESPLAEVRSLYPGAPALIGDLRDIDIPGQFDIIAMFAVDSSLTQPELSALLTKLSDALSDDGILLLDMASVLSLRQIAAECVKRLSPNFYRDRVFWAYWRTPDLLIQLAKEARLHVSAVFNRVTVDTTPRLSRRAKAIQSLPPWKATNALLVFQPA